MTWLELPPDAPFGPATLPYGVFRPAGFSRRRVGVAIGADVLDLAPALDGLDRDAAALVAGATLDPLLAAGPAMWRRVRAGVTALVADASHAGLVRPHLHAAATSTLFLPFTVADYVDFYASEHHATRVGEILRPGADPLTPNWKHLPIGYHGRAASVVVSGTPVVRPHGQGRPSSSDPGRATFRPSRRLDFEAEVGFVVGVGSALGTSIPLDAFADHVFGAFLLNDWSARDIQMWESQPLGPFLGKAFATSVSPWVVPLDALSAAWTPAPPRDPEPLPHLRGDADRGLDLALSVALGGHEIARLPFSTMYWTPAQMLAHLTSGGAPTRPGDVFASGTVSGPGADQRGCLLEATRGGREPLTLPDGSTRTFLDDGDEVTITATAPGPDGGRVEFGAVSGEVAAPREHFPS